MRYFTIFYIHVYIVQLNLISLVVLVCCGKYSKSTSRTVLWYCWIYLGLFPSMWWKIFMCRRLVTSMEKAWDIKKKTLNCNGSFKCVKCVISNTVCFSSFIERRLKDFIMWSFKLWHSLPLYIRMVSSLCIFKRKVKTFSF